MGKFSMCGCVSIYSSSFASNAHVCVCEAPVKRRERERANDEPTEWLLAAS